MRVAYFTGLRSIAIREQPEPRIEQPADVLLRVDRVGVCGSDVHYYTDGRIGDQILQLPATLGHECAGTVVEVGPGVERLQPGDRVAVDPAIACGRCDQCDAGRVNTCRNLRFLGGPGEAPGAAADRIVVPADNCLRVPDGMSMEEAALVEPLSIGLYAVRLGEVYPAARVAVLGAGPIGLSALLSAKATAPATVYVTDRIDRRLEIARRCGADWTGNPQREDVVETILMKEPRGLDLVFECSGDPACIGEAQRMLTPGGTLVLVGIPSDPSICFDIHTMRRKELTFKNVRRQKGCIAPAIRLISEAVIDITPLLTHHFPLDRIQEAFDLVAGYQDGVVKAIVDLSGQR
ncbi:MAG: alcohol dehydrogenase catalytic domain-containing protein [Rhodopirellula sp.]|nr:alcohol dehydrogenase catalytic domain-containing protein [Rhodopirellula sp.]